MTKGRLTGKKNNGIEILEKTGIGTSNRAIYNCVCHCGKIFSTYGRAITSGDLKSCGCLHKDFTGEKINDIEIVSRLPRDKNGTQKYECGCHCGKLFTSVQSSIRTGLLKSCGCNNTGLGMINNIIIIKDTGKKYKDNSKTVLCKCYCGKEFETNLSGLNCGKIKSCGCSRKIDYTNKKFGFVTAIEPTNIQYKYGRCVIWKCVCDCGKIFFVPTSRLSRIRSCGCDRSNFIKTMKDRRGEKHHCYNHKLTDEERAEKRPRDNTLTKDVLKKYNYTCIKCNIRNGKLCVHHLDGYHWYKPGRKEIENCVCICKECHKKFHKIYGQKWNTKEQFNQFIGQKI